MQPTQQPNLFPELTPHKDEKRERKSRATAKPLLIQAIADAEGLTFQEARQYISDHSLDLMLL